MTAKVKLIHPDAKVPTFSKPGDAGADLVSIEDCHIGAGQTKIIGTGIILELPLSYEGQVRSRSGLASKGIVVANSPGTIDCGYRGEVKVILHNQGTDMFFICKGDRIAQLVIHEVCPVSFDIVEETSLSDRGEGGLGSTGT